MIMYPKPLIQNQEGSAWRPRLEQLLGVRPHIIFELLQRLA